MPFGLDYPYWIDDPDFDLDFHVRELALPAPGTDEQARRAGGADHRPAARPRAAAVGALPDPRPRGRPRRDADQDPPRADRRAVGRRDHGRAARPRARGPGAARRAPPARRERRAGRARDARAAGCWACRAIRCGRCARCRARCRTSTRRRSATLPGAERRRARRRPACSAPSRRRRRASRAAPSLRAPKTSFNGRVSPHRRFAFGQLSLDEVKAVKNEHGCTVNDVVVSICAGAVRRWLIEHDELPGRAARRPDPGLGAHRASRRAPTATGSC